MSLRLANGPNAPLRPCRFDTLRCAVLRWRCSGSCVMQLQTVHQAHAAATYCLVTLCILQCTNGASLRAMRAPSREQLLRLLP
jgi:hypothetical protein